MRVTKNRMCRHPRATREAEEILRLAVAWAPYDGVPEDEVFCRFGIDRKKFCGLVWKTVRKYGCDSGTAALLGRVYPRTTP
ncbi:MAG: hypothetical protein EOP32_00150 [Rhodococcus sp. (in: high G+C Gram-positive bacteria)]|nr:MAG: hypothetical protein EOP32_00150 [Rhodococcus sp. (in: high G+C Gram-positive bacteria)]